jgi:Flp pilus assembly CpaE family ATPase
LADNYEVVIVDTPPGLSEGTCAAIRQSDRLAIVVTAELPSVHNAIRAIEYLTGLHYPTESIDIILNRTSRRGALNERDIEASLRQPIAVRIPNNYELIVNAINAGTPIDLTHKQDLAAPFEAWADLLLGDKEKDKTAEATATKGSRGLLSLFGSSR